MMIQKKLLIKQPAIYAMIQSVRGKRETLEAVAYTTAAIRKSRRF